ncbi:hypothetical protein N7532_003608 [Penicillium argentinense]|uniref:Uncharacterized protein n=1 Tax=Penicillium argentinense TaxID=1131581 RepID=A0A9W9KE60_9EURO|nr:uncharacterized protein N7532_003608 [Penicillium argentinense]KAJ5103079.1 hypothetical protein N7532_003608 [Penicillium argentinense]
MFFPMASLDQSRGQFKVLIAGGSLILYRSWEAIRILEQLGVWENIAKQVIPLQGRNHYNAEGYSFEGSHVLVEMNDILKRPIIFVERRKALEALYHNVKDNLKLHAQIPVLAYVEEDEIIITTDDAFTSEYNCIFAVSKNGLEKLLLPDAMVHNVYHDNYSAIAAAGVSGLVFWFLFAKSAKWTRIPQCPQHTDDDAEACIREYGSSPVGPVYTVKDLCDARVKATIVPIEEGTIKKWSHNRVVLIGDSFHKVGPPAKHESADSAGESSVHLISAVYNQPRSRWELGHMRELLIP